MELDNSQGSAEGRSHPSHLTVQSPCPPGWCIASAPQILQHVTCGELRNTPAAHAERQSSSNEQRFQLLRSHGTDTQSFAMLKVTARNKVQNRSFLPPCHTSFKSTPYKHVIFCSARDQPEIQREGYESESCIPVNIYSNYNFNFLK